MTLVTLTTPNSAAAEAWRTLRSNLQFAALEAPLKSIVIAAPDAGGSAAEAAANLAVVCAQIGRRVVLVDADLRQPQVHSVLGLSNASGLTEALAAPGAAIPLQAGPVHGLRVLTAGACGVIASDAVSSSRMADVLQELARDADFVLVCAAPAALYSDAAALAAAADAAILVVTRDRTRRAAVSAARDALRRARARFLGAVVV